MVRGGLDERTPRVPAVRLLLLDLVDQDHRFACDHAREGEDAKERHEAQGLFREGEGRDHPDESQRGNAEHVEQPAEALKLDHPSRFEQQEVQ